MAPRTFTARRWLLAGTILIALVLAGFVANLTWKRKLPSRGGLYFWKRIELAVPPFRQGDERWRGDFLGDTDGTLGAQGCAVSSAAMTLKFYGVETDPRRLNEFLKLHHGYEGAGWLRWEKAAEFPPQRVAKAYEDLPSYWLIDKNLLCGDPSIVRLRFPGGTTHFVVIVGKEGFDYLIRDPGAGARRGVYPLRDLTPEIEALRFYRRLPAGST